MIRFKIDNESTDLLDRITNIYGFKRDTITARIAFSLSLNKGTHFDVDRDNLQSNGREYTPTSNFFGKIIDGVDNYIIYKTIMDQHYQRILAESDFIKLTKFHLADGLNIWIKELNTNSISRGNHIDFLMKNIKDSLELRKNLVRIKSSSNLNSNVSEYKDALSFIIGSYEDGTDVEIKINDLREFDNRNIAIAGMAGSGKTQLVKDILYQISKNSNNQLKFIFFDYKGEGNPEQLKTFLNSTDCEFIDIVKNGGIKFNPFSSISLDERERPFSINAFVDTIATFVPGIGVVQKNSLKTILRELLDNKKGTYPTINELFQNLQEYYETNKIKPDSLYSSIQNLTENLFNVNSEDILNKSLYLNLPPNLSDVLRQLLVFLLLRYFNTYFSSTNDVEPLDNIIPLRYVIVIDEAHVYLKNRNARKALEELLRLLRSKGVIVVMLSQGVEDYKTKDFDFASQVKLPICLNVQNKDYRMIESFVGTSNSKFKLEAEIKKLDSGLGLINLAEPKTIKLRQFWETIKKQ
nr:DndE family protein [uncultured Flavobacterium sp.]